ncbi:MAG: PAS domain S-box protein [Candidatus Omnitrophica bacterium]|nr:PAS domain S-box protein [Candidatus Omnitrophota bacterium]
MAARLLDKAGIIIICLDAEGNIIFCNEKTEEITGTGRIGIIGSNWLNILYRGKGNAIKQDMLKAVLNECRKNKRSKDFETLIQDSKKKEKVISWNLAPLFSADKEVEAYILAGHDITAAKEAESSSRSLDQTLKDILSSLSEYALYVTNLEGNITYFGMGSEIMLGWNKKEIIFKHAGILHREDKEAGFDFILEKVNSRGKFEKETLLSNKAGEIIPVVLTANRFLNSEGKHSGYIFVAKDITERKKLEYQAFQAEKLAALGLLSAGIAHEINNPLLVISGRSDLLMSENLDDKVKDDLRLINTQAGRIQEMVDRILKFSQKTNPDFAPVDINEAIKFILPFAQYGNFLANGVEIRKDFAGNLRPVKGNLHQLQEVFLNLIINAYQSMPEGGLLGISTSNFEDAYAIISIKDNGMGIPEDHLKDVFMPFYSTKKKGKGLGLSICHNIIKNHNGSIELESKTGRGSTFIIKLPFI